MANLIVKLWRKRKAVSPVIATILIIALTVTAAAIVYFVVVPLLQGKGQLVVMDYDLENDDATPFADTLTVSVSNIGTSEATVSSVTAKKNGVAVNWHLEADTFVIAASESLNVICLANDATQEFGYGELATFTLLYDSGNTLDVSIKVSAKFSHFVLLYYNDFETATDLSEWTHTLMHPHGGAPYDITGWEITDSGGNKHVECTTNHCQFITLEDPLRDFYDVNISYDLRTSDNDGNGIIYRYDNSGPYPNFYCVWFTQEHPGASNPSTDGDVFDWNTPGDIVIENKVTIHYVEGDADGYNWYKIAEADWTRANNVWYSWRVIADGVNGELYIDNAETSILSWSDSQLSHGFIGFVSFANDNSDFDNIYVWQTVTP